MQQQREAVMTADTVVVLEADGRTPRVIKERGGRLATGLVVGLAHARLALVPTAGASEGRLEPHQPRMCETLA